MKNIAFVTVAKWTLNQ